MSGEVWVSEALNDVRLGFPLMNDIWDRDVQKAIAIEALVKKGTPVSAEDCPSRIWFTRDERKIPDLFYAGTHYIVSERAADVLRQFDLGGGALYPVSEGVYKRNNKTRIEGEYFTWIFGNVKTGFLEGETPEKTEFSPYSTARWCLPNIMTDNAIAVSRAALDGPDVWLDPSLFKSLFVSGRLADALIAAGLKRAFRLYRCRVM